MELVGLRFLKLAFVYSLISSSIMLYILGAISGMIAVSMLKKFTIKGSDKKITTNRNIMTIEGKNPIEENRTKQNQIEPKNKFKEKLLNFLKNYKAATVLGLLLLFMFIWFSMKIQNNEKQFENEKIQLITKYETERDSLQIKHLEFASKVFSWSVRSELLRNNTENLNQLLTVFVKESKVDLVQLINPMNKMVLLSSDKKFEGNPYLGNLDFELNNTLVIKEESYVRIITPVMGFNNRIGILIVELKKDNNRWL